LLDAANAAFFGGSMPVAVISAIFAIALAGFAWRTPRPRGSARVPLADVDIEREELEPFEAT
jgi:hypothetical protein